MATDIYTIMSEQVIIIGAGCAGYTAAIYTARANLSPLLITGSQIGGQLTTTTEVENFPGFPDGVMGPDLMFLMQQQAEKFGTRFAYEDVKSVVRDEATGLFTVKTSGQNYETRSIIVATGASARYLGIPGEEGLVGHGLTACATCDGAFYRDRIAVVVGGGNVAAEDAVFLSGLCEKVYLVHRRDTLRADKALQEKVFACENIEMVWDSIPQEILGQEEVTGLKIRNVKTGEERELEADGVFIAVGIVPSTALVKDQLKLDENGYICAGEEGVTSAPGVFAAGDIRTKALRQVVTAVSDGANAVASAQKYLWRTDNGNH